MLPAHSSKEEYRAVLDAAPISVAHRWDLAARRQKFVKRWPDLSEWMQAPLPTRVGRLRGETRRTLTDPISYEARDYLYYLALTGRLRLDYEWLFAISVIWPGATASRLGIDLGVAAMADRGMTLGYSDVTISMAARWLLPRLAMHAGITHAREIRSEHLDEIQSAVDRFGDREDLELYHAPRPRFLRSASRTWSSYIWRARMILYHDGHVAHPPRKYHPGRPKPPGGPPAMQAVVDRWLEVSASQFRPATVYIRKIALRLFLQHIRKRYPEIASFREVSRLHVEDYLAALAKRKLSNGVPMALRTRRNRVMGLVQFFREVVELEWEDGPGRILIDARDAPRCNEHVPRYIPNPELDVVMEAVSRIACRFRRVALLLARWSGARRNEIARLSLDCLDMYPDGKTPRLRIPAGKTYRERVIPVHPEAAEPLRELISFRRQETDRPLLDEFTGEMVRYVFSMQGRRLSTSYLFTRSLQLLCEEIGLLDDKGIGTINAHRFRHTLGTQLANSGATIQTVMKVLGHQSRKWRWSMHISPTRRFCAIIGRCWLRARCLLGRVLSACVREAYQPKRWIGSRPISSRPSWSWAIASDCPRKALASVISI